MSASFVRKQLTTYILNSMAVHWKTSDICMYLYIYIYVNKNDNKCVYPNNGPDQIRLHILKYNWVTSQICKTTIYIHILYIIY